MIAHPLRTRLMTSTAPAALYGCGIPGSHAPEFQPSRVGPPMIDLPTETNHAE